MTAETALIFGAGGQDAHYLRQSLAHRGVEPISVSRSREGTGHVRGDVSQYDDVTSLMRTHRPEFVFHLAANSTTRHDALFENHATIATGTLNVLEAVRTLCPTAKVFVTGSGVQFRNTGQPISEHTAFDASSPYAVARIQSVYAARYYRSLGVRVYVGYLFHHESPLRKPGHVSQLIAQAARRIGSGSGETLTLGDVSVRKEWTFAGDIAAGILLLVSQNDIFESTIGSGQAYSIEQWLDSCFGLLGLCWRDHVRLREGFRPEYSCLVSDPATIRSLGWSPKVALPALAQMMLNEPQAKGVT